jgi:hypothetical protein
MVITIRKTLLTFALIGAIQHRTAGQSVRLDGPPTILNLGSNVSDGSITVACAGKEAYSQLSCKVYRLWVNRPSLEEYQKSRVALQEDLATKSEADLRKMQQSRCSNLSSINSDLAKNLKSYSPGRAASAQNGYEQMKAACGCTTKQCITSSHAGATNP